MESSAKVVQTGKNKSEYTKDSGSEALQEFEFKLSAIDKTQAIVELNSDGTILAANKNFLDIFGYRLDEIQGKHHGILVDESYRNSSKYDEFWDRLKRGENQSGEFNRIGKNGKQVCIIGSYHPICNAKGEIHKVIKYATDITKLKQNGIDSEVYLARCKAVEQATNEHSIVSFADMQGKITYVNDMFCNA